MSFIDDVSKVVSSAKTLIGSFDGLKDHIEALQPLANRALLGDRSAETTLRQLVTDPTQPAVVQAAARILVEYVETRKKLGNLAAGAGVGLYPGQVAPLVLVGAGLVLLLLWRRR